MKILQINTVYGQGSTGKIARELHDLCLQQGMQCLTGHRCGPEMPDAVAISTGFDSRLHGLLARFTMFKGCFSYFRTKRFLKQVKAWGPDVVHLHNLHGSYVHIGLLMDYIRKNRLPVVFTLHDCWSFTAICSHYTVAGCDRWKTGCRHCPQRKKFSSCPVDLTKQVWRLKKKWFTGLEKALVVAPSRWLADQASQSYLKDHPVRVIHNGIDLEVFRPTPSDFRAAHGLEQCKLVLGVSFGWSYGKGLDVMEALARRLPQDYRLVLVGTDAQTQKGLPENILCIHRTHNQQELARIYTAADVFVNASREETYPTVNLEALACGTPVVTFRTGGSPETVDSTCGAVVEAGDVDALLGQILRICREQPYPEAACLTRAKRFGKNERLNEYLDLYRQIKD